MTLTHEHVQQLTAQFDESDHEVKDGKTYIREGAITTRLDEIDPGWTWVLLGQPIYREGVVIQTGRLTVHGVKRDGVGMEKITISKAGAEVNEAEKSAATDALKRAARLFGIGRYLLDLGKGQKPQPQRRVDKATGEITNERPATPKGNKQPKITGNELTALIEQYGRDTLKAALGVKSGWGDFAGSAEQARELADAYILNNVKEDVPF